MSALMLTAVIVICLAIVIVVSISYGVALFNSLVQVKNNVDKAFNNIDVLLQQRHDELPKLIDTCRGYMKHERDILDRLTTLREHYTQARSTDDKARIENELNQQYLTLAARWEAYPDLKASANFQQIQERISALEASIADRREFFNDSVNIYNIQIERFPHLILARLLRYDRKAFLEIPDEKKRDVTIDLT